MLKFRRSRKSQEVLLKGEVSNKNFISRECCATKRPPHPSTILPPLNMTMSKYPGPMNILPYLAKMTLVMWLN